MKSHILLFCLICLVVSCKKDKISPITPTPDDFNLVEPSILLPQDAYGILHNIIENFEIEIPGFSDSIGTAILGKGHAYFFANVTDSASVSTGCTVSLGIHALAEQTDHSYLYKQSSDDSLIYRNVITWSVACKSIDQTIHLSDFPAKAVITSDKYVYRLSGYTATNAAVSGADSIVYQLQTTTTTRTRVIQKTQAGNSISCNFSMSDLTNLDASNYALLTITGYTTVADTYSGKKYYSTFQQSTTKLVFVY